MKHAGVQLNFYLNYANFGVKMAIKSQDSYIAGSMLYTTYYLHAENPAERVKYTVESLSNSIPETMIYDYSANTFSYPSQGTQSPLLSEIDDYNFVSGGGAPTVTESRFDRGQTFYCLPSTDISKFKVAFTFGEFHGHSLVGKSIMIPTHKLVEANKKYNIIVNLYLSPIYLFNDGTTGSLTENPSKTPVGVVVDPTKKIAVALHDVSKYGSNFMQWSYSDSRESAYPATNYGMLFDPLKAGNSNNSYNSTSPAMSAAENYYNTVGYGNAFGSTNRWYIPTLEDFLLMGVSLGKLPNKTSWEVWSYAGYDFSYLIPSNAPETGFMGASPNFPPMDMTRFNKAFTDAGGTAPSDVYWTRTECQDGGNYKQGIISIGGGYNFDLRSKTSIARVRPFIKY